MPCGLRESPDLQQAFARNSRLDFHDDRLEAVQAYLTDRISLVFTTISPRGEGGYLSPYFGECIAGRLRPIFEPLPDSTWPAPWCRIQFTWMSPTKGPRQFIAERSPIAFVSWRLSAWGPDIKVEWQAPSVRRLITAFENALSDFPYSICLEVLISNRVLAAANRGDQGINQRRDRSE